MEVTCQLRTDQLSKKGTARIQVDFYWDGRRLRLSSGEKCRPKDWNPNKQRVKAAPGAYADQINTILERWIQAGQDVHADARVQLQLLEPDQMEAAIRKRYTELVALASGKPVTLPTRTRQQAASDPSFLVQMDRWIDYQSNKVSVASGRKLSPDYLQVLRRVRAELATFAEQTGQALRFEAMNDEFYQAYQRFCLGPRQLGLNSFGTYLKRIITFLHWARRQGFAVNPQYEAWEAPDIYRGADFFTQDELLRWAAVDFDSPAVHAYLQERFAERPGTRWLPLEERRQRLELVRDKLLQCCYFGLRISDANRLAPEHLKGDVVRLHAGKTTGLCVIPYIDDDVFKPRQLVAKYAHLHLPTCLPVLDNVDDYLQHVQHLADIKRIRVTTKVGRKTFATLKIYQGIPKSQVMLATGHKTEASFNRYLGIDETELVQIYRRTARRLEKI